MVPRNEGGRSLESDEWEEAAGGMGMGVEKEPNAKDNQMALKRDSPLDKAHGALARS